MSDENTDVIQGTLDLLILKTLSLEPMHGFGIARRVEQVSLGVFKVNPGSLLVALQRLERELAAVQADTRLLEEGYGPANLQLEIIKTYIGKTLLENAAVVRWLAKTRSEYLQQLQFIAEIKQLPSQ